jgi:hypothetical protein
LGRIQDMAVGEERSGRGDDGGVDWNGRSAAAFTSWSLGTHLRLSSRRRTREEVVEEI